MNEAKLTVKRSQLQWSELISNAIIFREKLVIVLNDDLPIMYHPYYLLTNDYGESFRVKGVRAESGEMLNFELHDVNHCETTNEEFQVGQYPEETRTIDEIDNRYVIYANVNF